MKVRSGRLYLPVKLQPGGAALFTKWMSFIYTLLYMGPQTLGCLSQIPKYPKENNVAVPLKNKLVF